MAALIKKILPFLILSLFTIGEAKSQKIITVDFCDVDEDNPIIVYDSIGILVHVIVDDTSAVNDNTLFGDLYYWYQTDSMASASIPPGYINDSPVYELIPDGGKFDTLHLSFLPSEVRLGPVNVICLWAAMQVPSVEDTIPCCDGFSVSPPLGFEMDGNANYNVVFPNPTEQYVQIRIEEIKLINQINIYTLEGKIIKRLFMEEFSNGIISLESLNSGTYLLELEYINGSKAHSKVLKR